MDSHEPLAWLPTLSHCVERGSADPTLMRYIDEILCWWFAPGTEKQLDARRALVSGDGAQCNERFEEFVDQLLIANPDNYQKLFSPALSRARAKTRYRQLIRLFHPDRGAKNQAWLTYRAERVNASYSRFAERKEQALKSSRITQKPNATAPAIQVASQSSGKKKAGRNKRRLIFPISRPGMRRLLGSAEKFQRQLVVWMIGLATLFVVLLLLSALVV